MPEADIDRLYDYDPKYLADILRSVKTIAMVGASGDKTKFSYGVLRQLNEIGYDILPVNPNPNVTEIRGLKVYHSLEEIEKPIDETKKNMAANPVRSLVDIDLFHVKKLSKIFSSLGLGTQLGSSFLACFRFFRALG